MALKNWIHTQFEAGFLTLSRFTYPCSIDVLCTPPTLNSAEERSLSVSVIVPAYNEVSLLAQNSRKFMSTFSPTPIAVCGIWFGRWWQPGRDGCDRRRFCRRSPERHFRVRDEPDTNLSHLEVEDCPQNNVGCQQ